MGNKTVISLILTFAIMLGVSACEDKQKTNILTNDVRQETSMKENQVKKLINEGADFLNEGKYDDAKSAFDKAILMDKANKGAYIEIKNKYMEKKRIDDAYYTIKLAISNNVDTENMKELLNDIKSKFEVTKLDVDIYQNNKYNLPPKIKAKINNEDKEVDVVWNNKNVDTSKLGTTKYEGKIEQYDRNVELNLKVIKVVKAKKTGYIKKVYEDNGKRYLKFDDVEFFLDEEAEIEAKKDPIFKVIGLQDSYYIRNKDDSLVTYKISPNVSVYVYGFMLDLDTMDLQKISYEKFITFGWSMDGGNLFHIYLENNVVVKIEQQFLP